MEKILKIYEKIQHLPSPDAMEMRRKTEKRENGVTFKNLWENPTCPIPRHDINDKEKIEKGN